MKKAIISILLILLLIPCVVCSASENLSIALSVDNVDKNRLFDVVVGAMGDTTLSGGMMKVYYDNSIVSFRSVDSDIYEIDAKDKGGCVELVFAYGGKVDIKDSTDILSIKFKSIGLGSFEMNALCYDFVNYELKDVNVDLIYDCIVTVGKDTVVSKSLTAKKNSDVSTKSQTETSAQTLNESSKSQISLFFDKDDNTLLMAVLSVVCIIMLFAVGVIYGRSYKKKEKKKNKND